MSPDSRKTTVILLQYYCMNYMKENVGEEMVLIRKLYVSLYVVKRVECNNWPKCKLEDCRFLLRSRNFLVSWLSRKLKYFHLNYVSTEIEALWLILIGLLTRFTAIYLFHVILQYLYVYDFSMNCFFRSNKTHRHNFRDGGSVRQWMCESYHLNWTKRVEKSPSYCWGRT